MGCVAARCRPSVTPRRPFVKRYRQWCAALALAAGLAALAGCAGGSPAGDAGRSGVTVFGDIDVGASRVR